jgi:hypothetical protein
MCSYSSMMGMNAGDPWVWDQEWISEKSPRNPNGGKAVRVTCPECGRRMMSCVRTDSDGTERFDCIPPHKVKKWWKKSKRRLKKDRMYND